MTAQVVAAVAGGAAAGALLTALTSLFTGWLSRRHDQRRWLLDKRLEVYVAFNAAANTLQLDWARAVQTWPKDVRLLTETLADLSARHDEVRLLAPPATETKSQEAMSAAQGAMEKLLGDSPRPDPAAIDAGNAEMDRFFTILTQLLELQRTDVQSGR
jgi:hypothetical protein